MRTIVKGREHPLGTSGNYAGSGQVKGDARRHVSGCSGLVLLRGVTIKSEELQFTPKECSIVEFQIRP